jgi:excisionase family DNA binding protein
MIVPEITAQSAHCAGALEPSVWLTAEEAAGYLRVQTRTLLLWARQGKVKGHTLSGTKRHVWRFRRIDLDAMLTEPAVLNEGRIKSAGCRIRTRESGASCRGLPRLRASVSWERIRSGIRIAPGLIPLERLLVCSSD